MRTLGAPGLVEPRFKAAIARGEIDGPRLVIAIRLLRPSHGTASFVSTAVDGPDEIRKCVRETFSLGAEWIKMMVTNVMQGDTFEDYLRGDMTTVPSFTREEVARPGHRSARTRHEGRSPRHRRAGDAVGHRGGH